MTTFTVITTPDVDETLLKTLLAYKRELTDQQISEMLESINPVVRKDGALYFIEPVDPRTQSFIWSPSFTDEAAGLTEISQILTLHSFGYQGFFKPSVEEVLAMIPVDLLPSVKAFEVFGPADVDDLNRQSPAIDAGHHVAVTVLYG